MNKIINLLILSLLISCNNVNLQKPNLKDTFEFIKQEVHQNIIYLSKSDNTQRVENVKFKVLNEEDGKCEYSFDFIIKGKKSFTEFQKFNLKDATDIEYSQTTNGIIISFSKESAFHKINSNDTFYHKETEWKNSAYIIIDRKSEKKMIKAFKNAKKLCQKNINNKLFEDN